MILCGHIYIKATTYKSLSYNWNLLKQQSISHNKMYWELHTTNYTSIPVQHVSAVAIIVVSPHPAALFSWYGLHQRCTNSRRQVTLATTFWTVAPNICGFSVQNLLHVTLPASAILRWVLVLLRICAPLGLHTVYTVHTILWRDANNLNTLMTHVTGITFYTFCIANQ